MSGLFSADTPSLDGTTHRFPLIHVCTAHQQALNHLSVPILGGHQQRGGAFLTTAQQHSQTRAFVTHSTQRASRHDAEKVLAWLLAFKSASRSSNLSTISACPYCAAVANAVQPSCDGEPAHIRAK